MAGEAQVETRVPAGRLERFVRDLFRAAGVPGDDAETIAAAVVGQEIRGLTTHGLRMVDWNLKGLAEGRIRAEPDQRTLSDHGMTTVIEGDHGVGMVGCMNAAGDPQGAQGPSRAANPEWWQSPYCYNSQNRLQYVAAPRERFRRLRTMTSRDRRMRVHRFPLNKEDYTEMALR